MTKLENILDIISSLRQNYSEAPHTAATAPLEGKPLAIFKTYFGFK